MLELEERGIADYQTLLEGCKRKEKGKAGQPQLQDDLKQLVTDEKKHAGLVRELLKIVESQAD